MEVEQFEFIFSPPVDMCGLLSMLYAVIVMVAGLGIAVAEVYVHRPMPALFEVSRIGIVLQGSYRMSKKKKKKKKTRPVC